MRDSIPNRESPASSRQDPSRRRFLQGGVALGAALVAGAGLRLAARAPAPDDPSKVLGAPLRPYGERSPFEPQVRVTQAKPAESGASFTPLDETLGIITPSALHFAVQHGGRPEARTEEPAHPAGETFEELAEDLWAYQAALSQPVLDDTLVGRVTGGLFRAADEAEHGRE